jgi:hypothetical protein
MIDDETLARARKMADEKFEANLAESQSFLRSKGATDEEVAAEVEIYRRRYADEWQRHLTWLRSRNCGVVH